MSRELIKGKVAKVLNSRELVINVGEREGVSVGMHFDVLDPKGDNIRDPDTGEVLGSLNRPKVRVQVVSVQEKMAVASTFREKTVNVGGVGVEFDLGISRMFTPPKYVKKFETLKTTEKTWEDISDAESYVKIGDPVIQANEISSKKEE